MMYNLAHNMPPLILKHIDIFLCPACGGNLKISTSYATIKCSKCDQYFNFENGIPLLFWPTEWKDSKRDVTNTVKSFYEDTPFPNYEDLDSRESLAAKAGKVAFAFLPNDKIPQNARILEAGCGTGQLSNFLGISSERTIFAADICLNSLKLGQDFKEKNKINNVGFVQMNLFKPVFKPESFDLVICSGVLHHTSDPFLGFQSISKLVKKGGIIIVGLYNTYGRIPTDIKRFLFTISNNRFKFLDSRLRDKNVGYAKKYTWFMDQYKNPHESKHTIGEVQNWFAASGIQFVNSIPKATMFGSFFSQRNLFDINPKGAKLDHFFVQMSMLFSGGKEGGFFVMIGRKNDGEEKQQKDNIHNNTKHDRPPDSIYPIW